MRDHLLIYLNGDPLRIRGSDAFSTLAEFLRARCRLTGTKVVCAEGDCGACAVLVGRPSPDSAQIRYASVDSCIQMMFQLDAAHIVTVEGLKYGDQLNPIQQSMVDCHGAQCGYCTPGFIVSLYDLHQNKSNIETNDVRRALVGNLCRCTGYDPIISAALLTDRATLKSLDALYPPQEMLRALQEASLQEVKLDDPAGKFFKPTSLQSAIKFRGENPSSTVVSGATDLAVQRNKGIRRLTAVISTAALHELDRIETTESELIVGAAVTLTQLEKATSTVLPELSQFLAFFGSPPIKNAATLAGNLVNASPIGDTIPALFVLDAQVELAGPAGRRWIKIEQFYTGYRKTLLAPDEILTRIRIPLPAAGEYFKLYKISKRKDLDISSFGAAVWMRTAGSTIDQIRIAYGGVGPTVMRLPQAEAFLVAKQMSRDLFEQAGDIARTEIMPISDVRGSLDYRKTLARNILIRFWHDLDRASAPSQDGVPA